MSKTFKYFLIGVGSIVLLFGILPLVYIGLTTSDEEWAQIEKDRKDKEASNLLAIQKEKDKLTSVGCIKDGKAIIGEHSSRTLKCGWGKPEKINRTIYPSHVREQWVYGTGNYLYFENDILVTIQN